MRRTSIVSIDVRGFRAFGTVPAHFELDAPLTVAHAGNSQGKTSLAEAVEFLLSGRSSRRELLGGAKAEYNDSLRNAHLPDGDDEVFVEAVVRTADGSLHRVRRNLTGDFGRGSECESRLFVDGNEVCDLSNVGFMLADPPVRAPVLLQHILRHALSTEPKQRVGYFKSLLSLSDLDLLRTRVAEARKQLEQEPDGPSLQRVAALPTELSDARNRLQAIARTARSDEVAVTEALSRELCEVAGAATGEHYSTLADAKTGLETRANAKAEALFPTARFVAAPIPSVEVEVPDTTTYREALASIEGEAARLLPVFAAVLRVDEFAKLTAPVDCPVCATPEALTPARVDALRAELTRASNLDQTAATTLASIGRAGEAVTALVEFVRAGLPTAGSLSETELTGLAAKLQDWNLPPTLVRDAHAAAVALTDSTKALVAAGHEVREALATLRLAVERRECPPAPEPAFDTLRTALEAVRRKRELHAESVSELETAIAPVIEERAEIADHRQLLTLLDGVAGLAGDVIRSSERQRALTRLKAAEKALQDASVELLDARFAEMSDTIKSWWLTIRPDELVDFMGVQTRAGGTRFVNLIAALHAEAGTSPVVRDALGVYSDSQLNALGLSIFLARTELLDSSVVVLDDPIPGSDPDHRLTFVQNTITKLLDADVQVILTTYDSRLADWTMSNHDHRGLIAYELNLVDPRVGTVPTQTSDMFSRLMLDAEDNLNAPTARGRRAACGSFRSAAERLAKQIIATGRTEAGTPCSVADVDAEASMLGQLVPLVRGFALDNGEKGQWNTFATVLNPGNHDDDVPSTAVLKVVRGNLRKIVKTHREHWPNGLVS
ncbi:hypothetical protein EU513_04200 [Yimella sp. RIT 621]|uniref:AAA family ATPase n=1 Tax=Yimella sp. RIT 621 TaxID=2510323 RepID=UPI00101D1E25|nr:AAA family ATPase [Yimella sp. RIT 621]RYG78249.1 hypothetical protein EU513_04200 [Yimella sp. RIT 621]